MNSLEKIFYSIKSSNTKEMKLYSTRELIKQLREYADHTLYILKNIYSLVSSENTHNRLCGAKLLHALPWFEYAFDFGIDTSVKTSDYVYLQSKELQVDSGPRKDVKGEIKKFLKLEHVGAEFVENNDIIEQGFVSIRLKTADVNEKNIENVYDFFEAINLILLSPDWFKRHGGFLSYCAIVATANNWDFDKDIEHNTSNGTNTSRIEEGKLAVNPIKVVLSGDLFNKIFEIFKNDKFNDFVGDVTSSPVKEAACLLLKYIYPLLDNKLVIFEITHLLTSKDWQEQFSALLALSQLKSHFNQDLIDGTDLLDNFVSLLIGLLQSPDEDVKFLSADLLTYIVVHFKVPETVLSQILDVCWGEISGDVDVSHASILILFRVICCKGNVPPLLSFAPLYPCFTSHSSTIRASALALAQVFDGDEFRYLLAEAILLETSGSYIQADILRSKIPGAEGSFATHFLRIISQGILKPYNEDDFACYDELFFTVDGIKSVGVPSNMNNRAVLFDILLDINNAEHCSETLLGETYKALYEHRRRIGKSSSSEQLPASEEHINQISDVQIVQESIEDDFKLYHSLKKMPIKEFKAITNDPFYRTVYTNCTETFIELLRLKVAQNIFSVADLSSYIILENSTEMLKIFIQFIQKSPHIEKICEKFIDLIIKLSQEARKVIPETPDSKRSKTKSEVQISYTQEITLRAVSNLKTFFSILGLNIIKLSTFKYLLEHQDRLVFFEECAEFLNGDNSIDQIFSEALEKGNAKIINKFLSNMNYNCQFVRRMLKNFDSGLLSQTIEHSNPSFNIVFVKPVLQAGSASSNLLSRILCSLHFTTDETIQDEYLINLIETEREEVKMLVNPSAIKEYNIEIPMSIDLRGYQKEGIKWISFLSRFNLNGVLADDMGLGKTVQTLCYVLNEMYSKKTNRRLLILCPASLSTHWQEEIRRVFNIEATICDSKCSGKSSRIAIMSYDMFRRDTSLDGIKWYFTVFDEGHLLKNRGTVLYAKCKRIIAEHMIILTGTPVHNSTEDLFSLFEIIQPGYLGDESTFSSQYGCRVTEKNVQAMEARLEALHKKTVPFIMRRLKSEVLTDLPPKIIKDLAVEMDGKQEELYKKISSGCKDGEFEGYASLKSSGLSILKDSLKAASHPFYFSKDIGSAKTATLLELFSMCGNSKVLVFFQLKSTIDYVIEESGLSNYLRLDGSVPVNQRGNVVTRFNTEAVPYLFLTTAIGGLGLNLTAADVVVFYEHDWNPFNDLQAMDRAHRLGQKKTVNVFRLICKGTIEEKVMNYQNFKLYVANTIVTQQNNDIQKMETKDILEKFQQ